MGYAVEPFLSTARLTPYRDAAGTDRALALYEWNFKISGEFFVILGQLEVVLRNAIDTNLRTSTLASTSGSWLHDQGTLRKEEIADIAKARSRRLAKHRGTNHDDIVSELNFGFRTYLLTRKYESSLWTPYLRHAFPNAPKTNTRWTVERSVRLVNDLRNRIAHHEPVFYRNLEQDLRDCMRVIAWIDSSAQGWVDSLTPPIREALQQRP